MTEASKNNIEVQQIIFPVMEAILILAKQTGFVEITISGLLAKYTGPVEIATSGFLANYTVPVEIVTKCC
jgi:hypothetical protein